MYFKNALFFFVSWLLTINALGQTLEGAAAKAIIPNAQTVQLDKRSAVPTFLVFAEGEEIPINEFEDWERNTFQYREGTNFITTKTVERKTGFTHQFREQYFNGVPVEHSLSVIHRKAGRVHYINGLTHNNLALNTIPTIEEDAASEIALRHLDIDPKDWWYNYLKAANFLFGGRPWNKVESLQQSLVIYPYQGTHYLAWKIQLSSNHFNKYKVVYVDAHTADPINTASAIRSCSPAQVETTYRGNQQIFTNQTPSGSYILQNNCPPYDIRTKSESGEIENADNLWNTTIPLEIAGVTAHWGITKVCDYFQNVHQQTGTDGTGTVKVQVEDTWRAFYIPADNLIVLGLGAVNTDPSDDITTPEVCGHEFTHGLLELSGGITATDVHETNALHEAMADIFGDQVEAFVDGLAPEYSYGEELPLLGIRLMSDPNSDDHPVDRVGSPDTYLGEFWKGDPSFPHTDGGVLRYWFYLVSEGGTGVNNNGYTYNVPGVGHEAAATILYEAVVSGSFGAAPDYHTARNATIQAATAEFGSCSLELESVIKAWLAVGLGTAPFPDLMISNLQLSGSNSIPEGGAFSVNYDLSANGQLYSTINSTAVGFYILPYCSAYSGFPFDIKMDPIACGSSTSTGAYLHLPAHITPGNYYLIARIDIYQVVTESNELNNSLCVPITVTGGPPQLPDFVIPGATVGPSAVHAGSSFQATTTVDNQGNAYGGHTYMDYYLSADNTYSTDDIFLSDGLLSGLSAGSSITLSRTLLIPGGTPSGNYYIICRADCYAWQQESDESNNTTFTPITVTSVTGNLPDLIVNNIDPSPAIGAPPYAAPGQYLGVNYDVVNLNPSSPAGSTVTRFYLSADNVLDAGDVLALTRGNQGLGASFAVFPIPLSVTPNQYYRILIEVDSNNDETESDETNNMGIGHVFVTPSFTGSTPNEDKQARAVKSNILVEHPLRVFPNPTRDQFTITYSPLNEAITIHLLNSMGQRIISYSLSPAEQSGQWKYIGEQLPAGLYYLQWQTGEESELLKLIVE